MRRLGFCFLDRPSVARQIELVRKIENLGYESAWVTETRLARDAFSVLGAFAAVTKRVKLATLDELAPGRIICGLGAYWDPLAWKQGIARRKPVTQMREYVHVLRRLLALEAGVTFEGEFVQVRDLTLDLGHGASRTAKDVKIYLGPTGPVMTRTAGEIADGAPLNGLISPQATREMVAQAKEGARGAGRPADAVDLPQLINVAMSDDHLAARRTARYGVAKYLGQQPHIGKANAIEPELLARINAVMGGWPGRPGGVEEAMTLVSDAIVDRMTISGTATHIKDRIAEWLDAGISYPVILPLSDNYDEIVETLAPGTW